MPRLPKYDGLNHVLFISGNVHRKTPLFLSDDRFSQIFFKNLKFYLHKFETKLHGFVLMPNHFHLLTWLPQEKKAADFLRDFKSFTAKEILDILKAEMHELLPAFRIAAERKNRRAPLYRIFQPDNYVFNIFSFDKLEQKLNYIHRNPVKAGLANEEKDWPYSSWHDYYGEGQRYVEVDLLFDRQNPPSGSWRATRG